MRGPQWSRVQSCLRNSQVQRILDAAQPRPIRHEAPLQSLKEPRNLELGIAVAPPSSLEASGGRSSMLASRLQWTCSSWWRAVATVRIWQGYRRAVAASVTFGRRR